MLSMSSKMFLFGIETPEGSRNIVLDGRSRLSHCKGEESEKCCSLLKTKKHGGLDLVRSKDTKRCVNRQCLLVVVPMLTQLSIPPGLVNEDQLRLGRQRQVWLIPVVDKRVGVQVKL